MSNQKDLAFVSQYLEEISQSNQEGGKIKCLGLRKPKPVQKVVVDKKDLELIMNEFDLDKPAAEQAFKENGMALNQTIKALGSWNSGSKRLYSPIAENFHKRGYVVVMPDYTLWPEGTSEIIINDIQMAIEWTIKNISDYGGSPDNIYVFGHSAGAHSVCLSIINHAIDMMGGAGQLQLHKVKGLFLLNGPYDIVEHFKWESKRGVEELSCMKRLFQPMENHSPTLLLQKHKLNSSYLPQNWIMIHTRRDGVVPYESSSRLYDELERIGIRHLRLIGEDVEEHAKEIFEMFLNVSDTFDSIDHCNDSIVVKHSFILLIYTWPYENGGETKHPRWLERTFTKFQMSDYYQVLGVPKNATEAQIREAYIRESLTYHPDRNSSPDATERFQEIANAYFVLSDKERRLQYDEENNFIFTSSVNPIQIFSEMFNDLMVPEVPNPSYFWQPIGSIAGVMLGFIVLNVPGAVIGGYYGNKAGKVRDMKGVSVYEAYTKLSHEKRQEIMGNLGKKFLTATLKPN
ncbi:hypothetical protein HDV04_001831 [Boothiomyces sp. JEL0838]|nr:hypothetical protein HDV04_001831 [Boothiomyces sp. JEL0838]